MRQLCAPGDARTPGQQDRGDRAAPPRAQYIVPYVMAFRETLYCFAQSTCAPDRIQAVLGSMWLPKQPSRLSYACHSVPSAKSALPGPTAACAVAPRHRGQVAAQDARLDRLVGRRAWTAV